ncbi:hypothetical protein BH23CHL7_BH23CHL7_10340 [soil metagenome]
MKRQYRLGKRAQTQAETRRRIVEATVALHQQVGPAATRVAEIARRAGVQRQTVYKHFPADAELFAACSTHWRTLHPMPDPQRWAAYDDRGERLRMGLAETYAWYRETRSMTAKVLRDARAMPSLQQIIANGLLTYLDHLAALLVEPLKLDGRPADRARLAARAAIDFDFWQLLERLGDEEAARLGTGLVEFAARPSAR